MRAAYLESTTTSDRFYGPGTADWDLKAGQIVLNRSTADYLYTRFTPTRPTYRPGLRPRLDAMVQGIVTPAMSERQKLHAILAYAYQGFRKDCTESPPKGTVWLNVIEEDIPRRGGGQCEDRARLILCLCQAAGIQARFIASYIYYRPDEGYKRHGGHAIVEAFIEGGWAFCDSCWGFHCLHADGRMASLWDIVHSPDLVHRQPEHVCRAFGRDAKWYAWYRDEYLTDRQVITLANYSAADYARYDWTPIRYDHAKGSPSRTQIEESSEALRGRLLREIGVPNEKVRGLCAPANSASGNGVIEA